MSRIIAEIEKQNKKKSISSVKPGDQVKVISKIFEGSKERQQTFQGIVIKTGGTSSKKYFTVRKIVTGIGVEKTFLIHSPNIVKIIKTSKGYVKRAKLYYLRKRIGKKATKIKTIKDK